ncbi:PIG-L family deacetylase [Streptomyces sp. SPB162]|uniref:PIG-L family deacetylase n=1 Tax=Streptomyces sp. SPB162 TaxID=2940560 RepID=UPI0024077447|nr:PIG-L family deacetylase [Streptomyces sp. SPB162]MDF9816440.1 LmbE family N-acetylglucosaminyl deacetylase [Streptomyces sp. SPB162]
MQRWGRRRVLTTTAAAGLLAGGGGLFQALRGQVGSDVRQGPVQGLGATATAKPAAVAEPAARLMHICAHPDDDLYFMNPDLQLFLNGGATVTSIYLAAGEADGRNADIRDKNRKQVRVDFSAYSEARENGLRAAYALLATGDRHSPWHREAVRVSDRVVVERDTLTANPRINLYFLNSRIVPAVRAGLLHKAQEPRRLRQVWIREDATVPSLTASDSPVQEKQEWNRQDILDTLGTLLRHHRPTVVHTMDPDPEHLTWSAKNGIASSDHQDHTATAQFALAALRAYQEDGGSPPVIEHFRAYANKLWPGNLSKAAYAEKLRVLGVYGGAVPDCVHGMCGDQQVADGAVTRRYGRSTWLRHQPSAWMHQEKDGRLTAYTVIGGRVAVHSQRERGGARWSGPVYLPGWDMTPGLATAQDSRGNTHLVGLRRTALLRGTVLVEVVYAVRTPDGKCGPWQTLGNPQSLTRDWERMREVGVPAAAIDGSGVLHVFVRNFGRGVSRITVPVAGGGSASDWKDMGGANVQDALTALTTRSGRIELFAPSRSGILRWHQPRPGAELVLDTSLRAAAPASPVTAVETAPERITLFYRQPGTAHIMSLSPAADGSWPATPTDLGGHDGTGPVAALRSGTDVILFHRNGRGTVSWRGSVRSGSDWTDSGHLVLHAPAAALDANGRAVLAVIGADGRLSLTQQTGPTAGRGFDTWRTL